MAEDDWEKWAGDDAPDPLEEKAKVDPLTKEEVITQQFQEQKEKQQKLTKEQQSLQKSKQSDMSNVFDLFGTEGPESEKKITKEELQKIGENFAMRLNLSNVSPMNTKEFLKSFLMKIDKKLTFKDWEEIFQVVEQIYIEKKKVYDVEEAKKKKQSKEAPKGLSWGKTKNIVQNDDDDDDDFM